MTIIYRNNKNKKPVKNHMYSIDMVFMASGPTHTIVVCFSLEVGCLLFHVVEAFYYTSSHFSLSRSPCYNPADDC